MQKNRVVLSALIVLSFCLVVPALAMPPGSGGMPGAQGATAKEAAAEAKTGEKLVVTLEFPRNSPWLAGQPLPKESRGDKVTLKVPVVEKKFSSLPMAVVDDEPLTVGDFRQALRPYEAEEGATVTAADQDPDKLLERLIDTRVLVREAREIGLQELPEVADFVESFKRDTLRELLMVNHSSEAKENEKEVEQLYREAIKESKIKALVFVKEEEAKAFAAKLKAGGKFEELAIAAVKEKKAEHRGGSEGEFIRHQVMAPEWSEAISKLKKGQVSKVISGGDRYVLIKLLETRSPESPEAKAEARKRARNFARNKALVAFNKSLMAKYVKLDKKLFDSIDFSKDIDKLAGDKRVLAEVKGGKPVTVGDVAEGLKMKYYHGIQRAIEKKSIDKDRITVLNEIIANRVFLLQAMAEGLDRSEEYKIRVRDYEASIMFGAFLQRVILPEVKVSPEEVSDHYKKNIADFTSPEMLDLHRLVFTDAKKAQEALAKLQKGTDFQWLEANAPGQAANDTPGLLWFGNDLVATKSLSADLRKALKDIETGQGRLFDDGKGHHYLLYAEKVVPSRSRPFEEVKEEVKKKVFSVKLDKTLKEWSKKLRQSYPVEIFAKEFNQAKI